MCCFLYPNFFVNYILFLDLLDYHLRPYDDAEEDEYVEDQAEEESVAEEAEAEAAETEHEGDISGDDTDHEEEDEEDEEEIREEDNYATVLHKLSKKWIFTQRTHKVSATATDKFWNLAIDIIPVLMKAKERENIVKKTPTITHQRKKMSKKVCPKVKMRFGFKNKSTGAIETVDCDAAPIKTYQGNPDYIKVYEEAHVEVN